MKIPQSKCRNHVGLLAHGDHTVCDSSLATVIWVGTSGGGVKKMRCFRPASALAGVCSLTALTFERPTRDEVFKHLMQNDQVGNDFIRCFTPYKDVVSSELYGNTLRPLRAHKNLLNILRNPSFEKLVNKTGGARLRFPKCKCAKGPASTSINKDLNLASRFCRTLKEDYENIKKLIHNDNTGICDIIAKLPNGDFVLVAVQVAEEKAEDA